MDYQKLSADFGITGLQESLKTISEFFGEEPTRLLLKTNYSDGVGIDLGFATIWEDNVEYNGKTIAFNGWDAEHELTYYDAPLKFVNKLSEVIKNGVLFKVCPISTWGVYADYVIAPNAEVAANKIGDYNGHCEYAVMYEGDPI